MGTGGMGWAQEGWGGHRRVPRRPQPQAGTDTLTPVPEEPHPPRCEHCAPLATTTPCPPERLCHGSRLARVHGGALSPLLPGQKSPTGSRPPAPEGCLVSGETRSRGGRRHMVVPSSSSPWLRHAASLPAQTRRLPARAAHLEEAALAKPNPQLPATGAGRGTGGARPPPPTRWHRSRLPGAWRRERVPGSVPRGMETSGAGASSLIGQESTSAPEPGSQNSAAGDSIAGCAGSAGSRALLVPRTIQHSTREAAVGGSPPGAGGTAGRGQGDAAAQLPAHVVPAAARGHVFCISSIPEQYVWQQVCGEARAGGLRFRWWLGHLAVQMLPEVSVWGQTAVSPGGRVVPGDPQLCILSPGAEGFGRDGAA